MSWAAKTQAGKGAEMRSLGSVPTGPCTLDFPGLWERSLPRALGKAWSSGTRVSHLKTVEEGRPLEV